MGGVAESGRVRNLALPPGPVKARARVGYHPAMFGLGALLIVVFPAVHAPGLRPPAPPTAVTAAAAARPRPPRPSPAVVNRRATRPATSVASDRSAVTRATASFASPRTAPRPVPVSRGEGPLGRGTDARAQRGPPLRFR
jgi:hypothetical protein